jgi:DNA-directed RNA polymerase specialized sigma subunit
MSDEIIPLEQATRNFDRNQKIVTMIEEGLSYAEIGRQLGLTRARISQIALDYGYVVRPSLVSDKRKNV